ncbi:Uncharacterized protein SCF082_LOCUS31170 [Durusdinium trenchii]|uniref:Uncharacterized protein n=1 Tax=Durusdinium trenchii TaxID=1381693 RepID=A0ABP0N425_9DINO
MLRRDSDARRRELRREKQKADKARGRSGGRVRFSDELVIHWLPQEHAKDAWMARHGPWVCAPKHDELWDGTARDFRERELSAAELKRVKFDDKVRRALPSSVFWVYKKYRKRLDTSGDEDAKKKKKDRKSRRRSRIKSRRQSAEECEEDIGAEGEPDSNRRHDSSTVPQEFIDNLNVLLEEYEDDGQGSKQHAKNKRRSRRLGPSSTSTDKARTMRENEVRDGAPQDPAAADAPPRERRPSSKRLSFLRRASALLPGMGSEDRSSSSGSSGSEVSRSDSIFSWLSRGSSEDSDDDEAEFEDALPWLEQIQRLDGLLNTTVTRSDAVETIWDQIEDGVDKLALLGKSFFWDYQYFMRVIWPNHEANDELV